MNRCINYQACISPDKWSSTVRNKFRERSSKIPEVQLAGTCRRNEVESGRVFHGTHVGCITQLSVWYFSFAM